MVVSVDYFRDRSVFETGSFSTELVLTSGRTPQTIRGSASSAASNPITGTLTTFATAYEITCQRTN